LRTVLVTGGGIGIGRACSEAFASAGDHVVVTDVLNREGEAVAAAIRSGGGSAEFRRLDVTDTAAADALLADVIAQRGGLDVIVANAGIARKVPLAEMTDAKWAETLETNLTGMLRVIRPAAGSLKTRPGSAIICISSIVGQSLGWPEHVQYTTAKAGVVGLVRGLALELAPDVRVNGIAPGFVRTAQILDPVNSLGPEGLLAVEPSVPLKRAADPSEMASVALFLASAQASYITGQVLVADGGLTISL
jgi:3-oxoacyl-[acyl-carrier protein] reductase